MKKDDSIKQADAKQVASDADMQKLMAQNTELAARFGNLTKELQMKNQTDEESNEMDDANLAALRREGSGT